MAAERRTQEQILSEIAAERAQLADALTDLRTGIDAKRRPAAVVGGVLAAGLATAAALRVVRRLRRL